MVKDKHDGMELQDDIDLKGKDITDSTGGGTVDGVDIGEGATAIQKVNEGIWESDINDNDATEYSYSGNDWHWESNKIYNYTAVAHKKHLIKQILTKAKLLGAGTGYVKFKIYQGAVLLDEGIVTITNTDYQTKNFWLDGWGGINQTIQVQLWMKVDGTNTIYCKDINRKGADVLAIEKWTAP